MKLRHFTWPSLGAFAAGLLVTEAGIRPIVCQIFPSFELNQCEAKQYTNPALIEFSRGNP